VGIWWSTILGLVLSAWAVRSPLHSADSNFGRISLRRLSAGGFHLRQHDRWRRNADRSVASGLLECLTPMRRIDMPRCDSLASPVRRLVNGFDLGEPAGVNGSLNHLNEARCGCSSGLVLSAARGTTVFHAALRLLLIGSRCAPLQDDQLAVLRLLSKRGALWVSPLTVPGATAGR
jgi:hypothetical protein